MHQLTVFFSSRGISASVLVATLLGAVVCGTSTTALKVVMPCRYPVFQEQLPTCMRD
jgi:hypothetical protein